LFLASKENLEKENKVNELVIDKLKDSFKVYCYENVQKILRMFVK